LTMTNQEYTVKCEQTAVTQKVTLQNTHTLTIYSTAHSERAAGAKIARLAWRACAGIRARPGARNSEETCGETRRSHRN
jgi:hypothetical protein